MAIDLDNFPHSKLAQDGFEFESEVRAYLRRDVPDDYAFRGGVLIWDGGFGKEIDFILTGPKGLALIEAKSVKDSINGAFDDENWLCTAPDYEDWIIKRPVETINRKRAELKRRVEEKIDSLGTKRSIYLRYTEPLVIFLFPDHAKIDSRISVCNSSRYHRAIHLADLASVLNRWRPSNNLAPVPAGIEHAKKVLSWMRKTNLQPSPQMIGPYKIVQLDKSSRRLTDNGLIYTIGSVEEPELARMLRGKRYQLPEDRYVDLDHLLPQLQRHAVVLSQLNHPNIHRYFAFLRSSSGKEFWVIEEQIDGLTLESIIQEGKQFESSTVRTMMLDIASALQALHTTGIIHRELTPNAILIERKTYRPVITNFELAKLVGSAHTISCDSLPRSPYRPLEVQADPHSADFRDDIYAWAAIFYRLLTGEDYTGVFPATSRFPTQIQNDLAVVEWCLAPPRDERPLVFADIVSALQGK
jgi:serine/threonine protein kinase